MKYQVKKPFIDLDGSCKTVNDFVEADDQRAAKLRRYGIIGSSVIAELEQALAGPSGAAPAANAEATPPAGPSGAAPAANAEATPPADPSGAAPAANAEATPPADPSGAAPVTEPEPVLDLQTANHDKSNNKNKTGKK